MLKTWKILATLAIVGMVGCTDTDGNGPVKIPYRQGNNTNGNGSSDNGGAAQETMAKQVTTAQRETQQTQTH